MKWLGLRADAPTQYAQTKVHVISSSPFNIHTKVDHKCDRVDIHTAQPTQQIAEA